MTKLRTNLVPEQSRQLPLSAVVVGDLVGESVGESVVTVVASDSANPEKSALQLLDVCVEQKPLRASSIVVNPPPAHKPLGSYVVVTPDSAVAVYELVTPDVPVLPPVSSE